MVDEGRVARLLRGVDERIGRLAEEQPNAVDRRTDDLWMDAIKYLFVTAIEGCIDVAHHVLASERWAAPDTNAGAFDVLRRHDVVDAQLARRMASAVGFRNVLVHQYAIVDDDRVIEALDGLDDLRLFIASVSTWLTKQRDAT